MFFIITIGFLGLGFIVIGVYLVFILRRHSNRAKQYRGYISSTSLDKEVSADQPKAPSVFLTLIDRNLQFVQTFFVFQALGKYIEIMSVSLSICAFLYPFTSEYCSPTNTNSQLFSIVLSLVAIVFVIISIYLSPVKRARQYIIAWRKTDRAVNDMIALNYKGYATEELNAFACSIPKIIEDVENSLTSDEE